MKIIRYFLKKRSRSNIGEGTKGVLTVLSNKGGVGKTSIAVSLAFIFSEILLKKTLLLELDCSPGDIGLIMDVGDEKSLDFIINDPSSFKRHYKRYSKRLDVIKGFTDPISAENVDISKIKQFLDLVKNSYEVVIIDTQTVLNGISVDALRSSDKIILVSDYTFESLARIKNLYEILTKKFQIEREMFKLVLNKKNIFSELRANEISKMTDLPVLDFIPFDKRFDKFLFLMNKGFLVKTKFFNNTKSLAPRLFK